MGEGVEVDIFTGNSRGVGTRFGGDDLGVAQVRGGLHGRTELGGELTKVQVLRVALDQVERGGVPETGGTTVAEEHFVPVGEGEEFAQSVTHFANLVLHRGLAVRGAHVSGAVSEQGLELGGAHLRGTCPESSVTREKGSGNLEVFGGGHRLNVRKETE